MRPMKSAERRSKPAAEVIAAESLAAPRNGPVHIPLTAFTLAGFRDWVRSETFPEHGQIFFLGDEIYVDMSGERIGSHGKVKMEITRVLGNLVLDAGLGDMYPDGTSVANDEAGLSNEPDAVFVSWESFESGRVRLVPTKDENDFIQLEGAPDWVLEVLSPSSEEKDWERLPRIYHAAGIREYWVVDARGDEIVFVIQVYHKDGYRAVKPRGGWHKSPVFGRSFRLDRARDRLGHWQYQLHVKK